MISYFYFVASVVGDYLLIHGGGGIPGHNERFGDSWVYSFQSSTWSILPEMALGPRSGHSAGTLF